MIEDYKNSMVNRLRVIQNKINNGQPLLLIEVTILMTILNVKGYKGTDVINMIRNSSLLEGEKAFRNTHYFQIVNDILDKLIAGEERIVYTEGVEGTVTFTTPITVTVPNNKGTGLVELQVIPYISTLLTNDLNIMDTRSSISKEFNIREEDVNPLEAIFMSKKLTENEKIRVLESSTALESRAITVSFNNEEEFYEFFGGSDGFIIKYDENKYISIIEINSKDTEDRKDSAIFSIINDKIVETDYSALDMIFY